MSLVKLAANKFTKMFNAGKLGMQDILKLREAGIVRSADRIAAGMERGQRARLGKNFIESNSLITRIRTVGGPAAAIGKKKVAVVPNEIKKCILTKDP